MRITGRLQNNGLIVDYCGILRNLRRALATFAGHIGADDGGGEGPPAKPHEELLDELAEAIDSVREFLATKAFRLEEIIDKDGFERNATIAAAKEVVNENDETRKRFEIMARIVFRKFRACLTMKDVHVHRSSHDAINIVYKSLQADRDNADISQIIRELHDIVGELTRIRDWEQKQATRDQVKLTIRDFLYSEETGLPESYSDDEVTMKSDLVFGHYLTQQQQGFPLAAG